MRGPKVLKISGKPNPRQREFFASRAKYTAYGGARGGGKSWALRRKLVGLCLNYPSIKCLLIRRSYGELKSNHLNQMLLEYPGILDFSEKEKAIVFRNGSRIFFGYCSCDRDVLRYQGQEYDVIAIDEATQLTEYQFSIFCASLRGVNEFPKRMYLTCNPGGIGHAWVKRLFIDRDFKGGENPLDYNFIPALVYDNEVLLKSDPSYVNQLKSLPKRLKDAWLYGRWDVFEGQFFSEFNEDVHVIERNFIPKNTKRFIAFDYGFDMLAALIIAKSESGDLFVERELCVSNLTLGEAAEAIVRFIADLPIEYAVASPDLWNRRQDSGKSGFEIMRSVAKMPQMIPADDRRIPGWRVLKEYLSLREGKPRLYIVSGCTNLISSMQALLCDPDKIEDAANEPHYLTHSPEALRYAVMSRFEPAFDREVDHNFKFSLRKTPIQSYLDY